MIEALLYALLFSLLVIAYLWIAVTALRNVLKLGVLLTSIVLITGAATMASVAMFLLSPGGF